MNKKTILITGISSGLGEALYEESMHRGHFVIGTFRKQEQVQSFNKVHQGKAMAIQMDVSSKKEIKTAFKQLLAEHSIDVLINNAGYGFVGALEESTLSDISQIFKTNVYGPFSIIKNMLPHFRTQGHGTIVQISSGAGIKATAGFGIYNASKFALEGLSEALADEVRPLGIKVLLVEPGPFRTNFAGSSLKKAALSIPGYDATAGAFARKLETINGHQEGDPIKAARAILDCIVLENMPLRLPLGKSVIQAIQSKIDSLQHDMECTRSVAESSTF